MLTNEELINMYKKTKQDFHLNTLYERTVNLLKKLCNQFSKSLYKWEFEDLLAEANGQWYICVQQYDETTGYKFTTFLNKSVTYLFYNLIRDGKAKLRNDSQFIILRIDGYKSNNSDEDSSYTDDIMNQLSCDSEYKDFEKKSDMKFVTTELERLHREKVLSKRQYDLLIDYYYKNKSRYTIADEQNKTRQAIDAAFKRTIHKLREYYKNDEKLISLLQY